MKITNISQGPRGVNTESGPVLLDPGQELDVELSAAEAKVAKGTGWFEFGEGAEAEEPPKPVGNASGLTAQHRGGGRYFIMDGEDTVGEAMTKEDAEAFNALSDEEKVKFAAKG